MLILSALHALSSLTLRAERSFSGSPEGQGPATHGEEVPTAPTEPKRASRWMQAAEEEGRGVGGVREQLAAAEDAGSDAEQPSQGSAEQRGSEEEQEEGFPRRPTCVSCCMLLQRGMRCSCHSVLNVVAWLIPHHATHYVTSPPQPTAPHMLPHAASAWLTC